MRRALTLLAIGMICVSLLSGCGDPAGAAAGQTATPTVAGIAGTARPAAVGAHPGTTARETAEAYLGAWAAEDAAALDGLLTPGAHSAWAMGSGTTKWLLDQRGGYGDPLAGQGRVLQVVENGGTATADIALAYRCSACTSDGLPDWPPADSVAVADRLTLERGADGLWLISYLDGSDYLRVLAGPTWTARAVAKGTATAASMEATQAAVRADAAATATVRTAGAVASRTAQKSNLNATATALWQQWFPQPTATPLSVK